MNLCECLLLLPGHGLDDFPRALASDQANELLSGWVALWHPHLIATCRTAPRWQHASFPPADLKDRILVVPSISQSVLRPGFSDEVVAAGSLMIHARAPWSDFQTELLQAAGLGGSNATVDSMGPDFAALGYAFLQIQLMTRQLRYSSNLDELLFSDQALQAAQAAMADDRETAERMLQSCFDQLGQERDHYYSLDVSLIDITLLAPTTIGNSLKSQLSSAHPPTSLLASAALVRKLHDQNPETMLLLRSSIEQRSATVVGGLDHERPHPLMTFDSVRRDLERARRSYAQLGVAQPRVFSRYSFGVVPDMPLHLRRSGYVGAILAAWEGGAYPQGTQAKISWEASDGTFLPALTPKVIDASDPSNFLAIGLKAGEALDREQVPALVLAHWPNRYCDYFHLLVRIAKHTPALGKWALADDFFEHTDPSYHQERLPSNQFRNDWFSPTSPLSLAEFFHRTQLYQAIQNRANSVQNLANLVYQLDYYHSVSPPVGRATLDITTHAEAQTLSYAAADFSVWAPQLSDLWDRIDALLDAGIVDEDVMRLDDLLDALTSEMLRRLAKHLVPEAAAIESEQVGQSNETARLIFNPYSCATRLAVHSRDKQAITPEPTCVHATGSVGNEQVTLIDTPQFGFVLASVIGKPSARSKQRVLAEAGGLLQNEFFEAQVDLQRGHLRSLHAPGRRGNRFSFSIARRETTGKDFRHAEMRAEGVETLVSSNVRGVLRSQGQLIDQGAQVGKFQIDFAAWRGSRVLEVTLRLHDLRPMLPDPWKSAYVLRFAWPSEAAIVRTFAGGSRDSWPGGMAISPQLIEIDEAEYRTHLLTGGLAFHRRVDSRFLETLIAVCGQTEVTHRFGIAVDLPHPQLSAAQFMDRQYEVALSSLSPVQIRSSWLFNLDVRNAKLDLECPLVNSDGRLLGQRLRMSETEGKVTSAQIRCTREVAEAYRVDNLGGRLGKLTVAGDSCTISLRANERAMIDVLWQVEPPELKQSDQTPLG